MKTVPYRVRDFMTPSPLTVTPDTEIMHVIGLLVEQHISGLPVVDVDGKLVGIVTERDCIRIALQAGYFDELGGAVAGHMTTDVSVAHADDSLLDVAELFANGPYRRLPVIENDRLIGLICRRDILKALSQGSWFSIRPA